MASEIAMRIVQRNFHSRKPEDMSYADFLEECTAEQESWMADIDAAIQAAVQRERDEIELMVLRLRDKHDKMDPDMILLDTVADMIRNRKELPDEA